MNIQKVKEFKSDISYFSINGESIAVVDKENRIYIYDHGFNLKKGFKIKLPENRPEENSVTMDESHRFLLVSVSKYPLTFWNVEEKKLLGKFNWHVGDVLCVKFDKEAGYFLSGGIDGKVYLYSVELLKMVSRLLKHKDFISDVSFDGEFVCAGSYDKSNIFVTLDSFRKQIRKLHLKKVKKVEKRKRLLSASEISDVINWNEEKFDINDKISVYREFSDFFEYGDYLFIAAKNRVVLYDLNKEILVNDAFLEVDASKIFVFNDILYYCCKNVLYSVSLTDERELLDFVLKGDYKKAYETVLENPFLTKTQAYEKLETLYKLTLKKAAKYFEQNLKAKAVELLKPFMNVLQKREEINSFIKSYENIIRFKKAFENKNYPLFYQIAAQYEVLKNTKYFKIVEKEWELKFEKAKILAIEGKISDAKEILKEFLAVSEKLPLINTLLKKANIFKILKEKLAKRDFKGFFAIIKEHPELKNTKEYKNVMEYAQRLYEKALESLKNENFNQVLKISAILEDIEGYELKAKELTQKANTALEFLRLFNEDKNKAFELAEKYPFLKSLKVYQLYEDKWRKKLKTAEKLAFSGKISKALENLKEYEHIDKKKARIKNMIKSAYLNHIYNTKDKNAIEKYIKVFGKDEELKNLIK